MKVRLLAVQAQARVAKLQVSVGVISPYSRQVQLLRRRVEERGLLVGGMGYDAQRHGVSAEVHTVDGFQVLRRQFSVPFVGPCWLPRVLSQCPLPTFASVSFSVHNRLLCSVRNKFISEG